MATLTIFEEQHHKIIHGMVWQVEPNMAAASASAGYSFNGIDQSIDFKGMFNSVMTNERRRKKYFFLVDLNERPMGLVSVTSKHDFSFFFLVKNMLQRPFLLRKSNRNSKWGTEYCMSTLH